MLDKEICKKCKLINKIYNKIVFQKYCVFIDGDFINFFMVFKGVKADGELSSQLFKCSINISLENKKTLYMKIFNNDFSLSIKDVPEQFNNEIEKYIDYENQKKCPYYLEHLLNNFNRGE